MSVYYVGKPDLSEICELFQRYIYGGERDTSLESRINLELKRLNLSLQTTHMNLAFGILSDLLKIINGLDTHQFGGLSKATTEPMIYHCLSQLQICQNLFIPGTEGKVDYTDLFEGCSKDPMTIQQLFMFLLRRDYGIDMKYLGNYVVRIDKGDIIDSVSFDKLYDALALRNRHRKISLQIALILLDFIGIVVRSIHAKLSKTDQEIFDKFRGNLVMGYLSHRVNE